VSGRIVVGALDKKTGELFAIVINAEKLVFTNVDCETGIKVCGLVVGRGRLFVVCNDRVRIYRLQREDGMPLDCEVMIRSIDHNLSDVWTHGVIIEDSKDVLLLTRPTTLSSKTGQKGKVSIVAAQERTDGVLVYRKGDAMHATYMPSELSPSGNNVSRFVGVSRLIIWFNMQGRIALCRRGICIMCTAEKLCREPRIDEKEAFQIDAATVIASLLHAQYTSEYSTAAVDAESPSMTTHSFQGQLGVLISRPSGQLAICCVDVFQDQLLVVFTQTIIAPSGEEKMVADMIAVKVSSRADDNPRAHTFAGRRLTRENAKPDYIRVRDDQIALHFAHSPVLEYYSAETFTVQSF
jgi:hypothetical protein